MFGDQCDVPFTLEQAWQESVDRYREKSVKDLCNVGNHMVGRDKNDTHGLWRVQRAPGIGVHVSIFIAQVSLEPFYDASSVIDSRGKHPYSMPFLRICDEDRFHPVLQQRIVKLYGLL